MSADRPRQARAERRARAPSPFTPSASKRALLLLLILPVTAHAHAPPIRVGSKKFTESVILADLFTQLARNAGAKAEHRRELGGSRILFDALLAGQIDAYPEYTGTLKQELVPEARGADDAALGRALEQKGIRLGPPLGFDDTYAIGMREEKARRLGVRTLSDLARHPELRFGFSSEFMERQDGWPAVRDAYGLRNAQVRGLEHELAYRALQSKEIDATDLYSTDAEIRALNLRVLTDDRHVFPDYRAVLLYRAELDQRAPRVVQAWRAMEGRIPPAQMISMNARARLEGVDEARVAADFLAQTFGIEARVESHGLLRRLARTTREHLWLVGVSLASAIAVGIPLGVLAARRKRLGQGVLAVVGVIQTVPSLALLVFMIPLLGIGAAPAVAALFLYALLPIVRNTHAGLTGIGPELRDSARALGLPSRARLWRIELPLASPSILAGIRTSAVITVGTATLGALIGAGGYGQPILAGIRLADTGLILEGAIPAALLALAAEALFTVIERLWVPRGLRLQRGR